MKIALDGPAGAGKSTIAQELAKRLNYIYINTGALYRAYTLKVLQNNIDINNHDIVRTSLQNTDFKIIGNQIFLDGINVTNEIYTPSIDKNISEIAANRTIREIMKKIQRKLGMQNENTIMEGRDIATVILPDADFKFYITADVEERAKRRVEQNELKGIKSNYKDILQDIIIRDEYDKNRAVAPLIITPQSIIIDSTNKTLDQTVEEILCVINK
jgi:cytidylate kinase